MTHGWLTTRECADVLGVTTAYIRAEIADGLLAAEIIARPIRAGCQRAHPRIRVYPEQFRAYCQRYWPRMVGRLPPAA